MERWRWRGTMCVMADIMWNHAGGSSPPDPPDPPATSGAMPPTCVGGLVFKAGRLLYHSTLGRE